MNTSYINHKWNNFNNWYRAIETECERAREGKGLAEIFGQSYEFYNDCFYSGMSPVAVFVLLVNESGN